MDGIEAGQVLGDDGAFQADWRDHAFQGDENKDIRENPTLANCKDIRSMAKQVVHSQSQIAKLSGGRDYAILPNEHSTPEEIGEFHTKLGRPPAATDYGYEKMEGANPEYAAKMSTALHMAGASTAVAEAVAKAHGEFLIENAKKEETEGKIADAQGDKAIRDRCGSTYDQEMANANLAITSLALPIDAEYAKQLAEDVKYDPKAQQFLAKIGSMIAEDPGLKSATGNVNFSPADAKTKAQEIMDTNPYWATDTPVGKPRNPQKHQAAIDEVRNFMEMAYPSA